jgi:hypothetical protein
MKIYFRLFFLLCFLLGFQAPKAGAQDTTHSELRKVRYLRKLEKKNERYVAVQETKAKKTSFKAYSA